MANNRMYLRKKSDPSKAILLAKYYPSDGWYIYHSQELIDEWFEENLPDRTPYGQTDLELSFETDEIPNVDKLIEKQYKEDFSG